MNLINKIGIFKKNSLYADMLFTYPSAYIFKRINNNITLGNIVGNNNLLYIHIPFCVKVCSFCSVHKTQYINQHKVQDYLDILYREIDYYSDLLNGGYIEGIYIGGGTPTILTAKDLDNLFVKLHNSFDFKEQLNIEIDAHPSTLTEEKLKVLSKYNISQVGNIILIIGIQSMQENVLDGIGRLKHSYIFLENLSQLLKRFEFKLHFDFVLGLPGEDITEIEKSVRFIANKFSPYSMSINAYDNTIDTCLYKNKKNNFRDRQYKKNLYNNISYISNLLDKEYGIRRIKTFYFKKFFEEHYNVIGIGAGSYGFIRGQCSYKNYDYELYVKNGFTKIGIESDMYNERVMFITHNHNSSDLNKNYKSIFGTTISEDFNDKLDYFLNKNLAYIKGEDFLFKFNSNNIGRFELINLYPDFILDLYD